MSASGRWARDHFRPVADLADRFSGPHGATVDGITLSALVIGAAIVSLVAVLALRGRPMGGRRRVSGFYGWGWGGGTTEQGTAATDAFEQSSLTRRREGEP